MYLTSIQQTHVFVDRLTSLIDVDLETASCMGSLRHTARTPLFSRHKLRGCEKARQYIKAADKKLVILARERTSLSKTYNVVNRSLTLYSDFHKRTPSG